MRHTARVRFCGKTDEKPVRKLVEKAAKLIDVPYNIQFFFVSDRKTGYNMIKKELPDAAISTFRPVWKENHLAFYYRFGETRIVVVFLTSGNKYLLSEEETFIGLLLHEIGHAVMDMKGVHRLIEESYKETYLPLLDELAWAGFDEKEIYPVMVKIGSTARLCLKEMYMLSYLIRKGCGSCIMKSYENVFPSGACPRPVFYQKNRIAEMRSDIRLFQSTVEFALIMLSILLPFEKYERKHAGRFVRHVQRCYLVNIHEVTADFRRIKTLFMTRFSSSSAFHREYFSAVFSGIRRILVQRKRC